MNKTNIHNVEIAIAISGYKCDSLATNIKTIKIGDKVAKNVNLRENGWSAPAIENIYPLSADNIVKRKYNIKKSLVRTMSVFTTILPTKNRESKEKDRKRLGAKIE